MAVADILTSYVAPALGMLLANAMFFSPLLAVLRVRRNESLGDLNPLPFPVILGNCCSWLVYSFLTHDWFLFFGNLPGILLGMFFVLSTTVYALPQTRSILEASTLVFAFDIAALGASMSFSVASFETSKFAWGLNSNIILMLYYGAPLSVVLSVIKTKSSAMLYWPTCLANFANGALWFSYGLWGVNDFWIWVPNGLGAMLAGFQIALCWVFPRPSLPVPTAVLGVADPDSPTAVIDAIKTQPETSQLAAVDSFRIPVTDPLSEA